MDPVLDPAWLQAAMEVPVTASLGPIAAVLRQLHSEHCRPEGVSKAKIQRLLRCLGGLCITLKDLSDQVHEPSFTALCWMKEVRELCYDTQDYFDELPPTVSDDGSRTVRARLSNIIWIHRRPQTKIAREFCELRARAVDASKRRRRLELGTKSSKPPEIESGQAGVSHHRTPRLRTQLLEEPMDDLSRLLAFDDKKEKQLKVITIFGFAGVGKTTAAMTMYHNHAWKFRCRAFLRVSRNPNMRRLLTSILSQIKAPPPPGFPDVQDLIDTIRTHLQGKRYLIILDDLWASSTWDIISCAFPHGDCCSRIITTTEIKDVALACSRPHLKHKYDMSPLNPEQSKQLFFSTVFGSGGHCPQDFKDVSDTIISKCGGLPLVIAFVGSLLASKIDLVLGQWKLLSDSLPSNLMKNPTHDGMKEFVNFIYNALPSYLKTCLLYLSMYPEGCIVWKNDLVNQWVAEGFISAEENAGLYFDDLVSRGMVQAVNINCDGEVLSCTVHHMVLDLIRHKSMVQNFIVIVGTSPAVAGLPDKVRPLSVQFGSAKCTNIPTGFRISQARSCVYFGYNDCVLSIEKYKLLRVLILHTWSDQDKDPLDLTRLGELFLLRYLKVQCNITVQLPEEMRRLQYLETLQVDAQIAAAPSDIFHLEKLLHLCLPSECVLPVGFARLTSLRTLGYFDLGSHSEDIVMDLAKLTNLKDIQLTCSTVQLAENQEKNVKLICSILENLRGLQSVILAPTTGFSPVKIPCIVSPPLALTLQRIQLSWRCCIFFSIPQWFGELRVLRVLMIAIRGLSMNDIDILKVLPSLTALTLYVQTAPAERITIKEGGFPVLTHFKFMCAAVPSLYFELGAMPHVQKLKLGFDLHKWNACSLKAAGFCYLTGLIEISVKFGTSHVDESSRKAAESALEVAIRKHPNTLIVRVQLVDVIFGGQGYKSMVTEETAIKEQEDMTMKKRHDIQQGMRKSMGRCEEHLNETVDTRYERTDPPTTIVEHHAQHTIARQVEINTATPHTANHALLHTNKPSNQLLRATMDLATGAMGSLLLKLGNLLVEEYKLQTGVKEDIEYMKRELTSMYIALRKVGDVPRDQLDQQVKIWADEVRDLSYTMEDIIDKFLVRVEGADPAVKPGKLKRLMKKMGDLFTKGKTRHEISDEFKGIKIRVQEAAERHDRYKVNEVAANPAGAIIADPRLLALYKDKKDLVGIDGPLNQLTNMLSDGHGDEQLKIVSIFGSGGLGKTTLAKALYDKLKSHFSCSAFVPVGRRPSMMKLLNDIILEIDNKKYPDLDERQLIDKLRGLLENKRYFIVIDDIWETDTWEIVRCALVRNNCASRIITTTRDLDVATKTGEVYRLEPLSHDLSGELFHARLSDGNRKYTFDLPVKVYDKILHKCGGVPLAVITMASLLVNKPVEFWSEVCDSIGFGKVDNKDVDNTGNILLYSYYDLPCHLRTCLLHMSIYHEDRLIMKDRLIWMWVGEGFINEEPGVGLFEIGERYFNELVNKSMLLPVEDPYEYNVSGCRVHDMVLDMICLLAMEENFVTILDSTEQQYTSSHANARRLAVGEREVPLASVPMLQVRSFNAMCSVDNLPSLSCFQVLRVLNLLVDDDSADKTNELKHLGKLVHLRYLGLRGLAIREVPDVIGYLKFLQVLDFKSYEIEELPRSIGLLSQLKCLNAPSAELTKAQDWIGDLTSLEELCVFIVRQSSNFVAEVGKLTELRKLRICCHLHLDSVSSLRAWAESLVKLQKIQVIDVDRVWSRDTGDVTLEGYVPPQQLRVFNLVYNQPGLPASITSSSLPYLSHLSLHVDNLDLEIFGRLPVLVTLHLYMDRPDNHQGHFVMGGAGVGLFPKLRVYETGATPGRFLPGAMPSLESLEFSIDVWTSRDGSIHFDFGSLVNLPRLQKVTVWMCHGQLLLDEDRSKAEETVRHAIDIHPNHPICDLQHSTKSFLDRPDEHGV